MKVTLEIPDEFAAELIPVGVDPARRALEEMVAQAYREGTMSAEQVRRALGFETRFEVDPFLLKHEICDFTIEDFRADMETQRRILG